MTSIVRRRKAHSKSREGCLQCKERHAKCNEVHPQCGPCHRADMSCSYSAPSLSITPLNEDSVADLELLEQWHRRQITGHLSDSARSLESSLVRLGFSHHYLLNSILALTALELYSEDQSRFKWYARAVAHQQTALSRVKPHFKSPEATDQQALLGFSAFTSMYAVAEPFMRPHQLRAFQPAQFDPVDELLRAFHFGRCTTSFVQQSFPPALVTESWLLLPSMTRQGDAFQGPSAKFPQFQPLVDRVRHLSDHSQEMACLSSISQLIGRIATLVDNPTEPEKGKVIWGWGLEVHQDFLDMCSARHSVALAVLAHLAVLMTFYREHWCLRSWPTGLLSHVKGVLGDEWKDVIQWPCDVVFGSVAVAYG
ncbi:Sterol uptake control protein 2 like [Verticillium longisporum]|nr:Sterol uptake control protein 2 like [Verticillium longisporum]KAH6699302.1 hypothetical protein EV126DRAFT_523447 [Verticillium dahliae]